MAKNTRYLFITGGVLSSLGKGIASASLGLLLQERGHTVTIAKFDPYINVDPGTMSPYQHGEVYVTSDGAETDLDLGHYERFLDIQLSRENNTTAGQIYYDVITKERQGKFLGKTVQVVPHITNEIKKRMTAFEGKYDVVINEIGGTVGDIESLPFLEASRQMTIEKGRSRVLNVHLTYVPYIKSAGELKTKPTQHSVKTLMEYGIQPDILLCRSEHKLSRDLRNKIALFCNVEEQSVIEALDVETIYEVPLSYRRRNLDEIVCKKLDLKSERPKMTTWSRFVNKIKNPTDEVEIAFVGKYTEYHDAYKSIIEAMVHAGAVANTRANLRWVDSEQLQGEELLKELEGIHGVLVAPGFGSRGVEGKIQAIEMVRRKNIPFFGICLGLQCAVIEYARNVCGLKDANSGEFGKFEHNVIDLMPDQKGLVNKGGTMRLGDYPCVLKPGTRARDAYKKDVINERHRHRYEVNNEYRGLLEEHGMVFSGLSPDGNLVEMIELSDHPWFVAGQFHPEFESTAVSGHPLFVGFIKAARAYKSGLSD